MKKNITPQQIDKALQITRGQGITIQGNFIFGDAAETMKTAHETLNYWKKNIYGGGINLNFIQPYPGTALYKHCVKKGLIKDEMDFVKNRAAKLINMTDNMTDKELSKLKVDIYAAEMKYQKYVEPLLAIQNSDKNEIHVECPYCNKVSMYRNYVLTMNKTKGICCRNCRNRFHIISPAFKRDMIIGKMIGIRNLYYIKIFLRKIRRSLKKAKELN